MIGLFRVGFEFQVVVAFRAIFHHGTVDVAVLGLDEACLDEVLAKDCNHARVFAAFQALGGQKRIGCVEDGIVGAIDGRDVVPMR